MSKKSALITYLFLLLSTLGCLVLVMPAKFKFSLPKPINREINVTRPELNINLWGFKFARNLEISQGLDIKGGTRVTLAADMSSIPAGSRDNALESAQNIIARRINLYGVSESTVQTARSNDSYRLLVEIPGLSDATQAVNLIGSTARLEFREYKPATASATASVSGMLVKDFVPSDLSGSELARSSVQFDSATGKPTIGLEFSQTGAKKFAEITKRNIGKPLAIFLDDYPITAPTVQTEIVDGKAQISGDFTVDSARQLSIALNAGALPVPISVLGQSTVEATLGNAAVTKAVEAGLLGLAVIFLFLILLYGMKGFLACLSLMFYGLVTLALYKLIPVTLSLAGIAGFLLSIGMAVDTNILVFERLREEERMDEHRSTLVKLERAFARAWNSIKDANITTLITCFVLYNPLEWSFLNREGLVRGFALTLAMGIALNIFCGMVVTRVLMTLFYQSGKRK
jgi:preprotein translocase subunit SecD